MAFNFNNPINSGLALRPRPPPPPPPPQVGPLQIRPGFNRNRPQPELDPQQQQQQQQQQQMIQQQLLHMFSGGHPMLPPGHIPVLGPQGYPIPPMVKEMHQPSLLKEPPVDANHSLPMPSKKDSSGDPRIVILEDGPLKYESHNDQDDKVNDKTERRRKRDRWGNQLSERDREPSQENTDRTDDQHKPLDCNSTKPSNIETVSNEGPSNQMWPGLMPQMGTFPVLGVNPLGMVDPGINPLMFGMMPQDGALIEPNPFAPGNAPPAREVIKCKGCTLFPPNPNMALPSVRERPLGCKTIFVGGLPEKSTEDMVREIFCRCGEICSIRLNNMKKFCHVRFVDMSSVDNALYLSGYRMKIGQGIDSKEHGRLHVDFAQARDDQHDYECQLRQIQREQRHREKLEQERSRIPSPPPVPHFNEGEANALVEKLKHEASFMKATSIAVAWLERGECNKRMSHLFYCMIQTTNSHVRRIATEKAQCEEELKRLKDSTKLRVTTLQNQFSQIERVFSSALHKKAWDHFTRAQRKSIETWKKQAADLKSKEFQESFIVAGDDEMEVSDSEDESSPRKKDKKETADVSALQEENDSLRCQLEAYKNEIDLIRADHQQDLENKEKELKIIQQTLKGTQEQLLESKLQQMQKETRVKELQERLSSKPDDEVKRSVQEKLEDGETDSSRSSPPLNKILERDAKLIGLISMFLHVHPFGAGVDYIWSFLQKLEPSLRPNEVETLMNRFPSIFLQELVGIGANMERRWQFIGFRPFVSSPITIS